MRVANLKTRINLGAFILGLVVIGGLTLVLAGDSFNFLRSTRTYEARFQSTAGLVVGAPVRMGGVEVGRVEAIEIEAHEDVLLNVAKLTIDAPYYQLLRADASVGLETQGLLGDKFVAVLAGTKPEAMADNGQLVTREAAGLSQALERSQEILNRVNSATGKIDVFASGLPEHGVLKGITQDFAQAANTLQELTDRLSSDASLVSALHDPVVKAQLERSIAGLEQTVTRVASIAEKIDNGQGTLGALVNDRGLYEDMRRILGHQDRAKVARGVFIEAARTSEQSR